MTEWVNAFSKVKSPPGRVTTRGSRHSCEGLAEQIKPPFFNYNLICFVLKGAIIRAAPAVHHGPAAAVALGRLILFQEQIYLCHGLLVASWLRRPNVGVQQGIKRGSNISAATSDAF